MLAIAIGSLALSAGPAEHRRKLSYAGIVGYSPGSQVTDHASTCPTCHAYPRTTHAILSSPASTVHHTSLLAIHPFACL